MFEQALVQRTRSRRWGLTLGIAVAAHATALGAIVLASAWSVDPVTPPAEKAAG